MSAKKETKSLTMPLGVGKKHRPGYVTIGESVTGRGMVPDALVPLNLSHRSSSLNLGIIDNSLLRALLFIVECLSSSLASTH